MSKIDFHIKVVSNKWLIFISLTSAKRLTQISSLDEIGSAIISNSDLSMPFDSWSLGKRFKIGKGKIIFMATNLRQTVLKISFFTAFKIGK